MKKVKLPKLIKKLDAVFSIWIRQRDKGKCFTCGKVRPWKEMHAGHYILRRHHSVRFDERNVNCQCPYCNMFLYGATDVYALHLVDKYGPDILKELNGSKQTTRKYTRIELEELIERYKV